ncbi:MAG: M48 family metallopeptidase [Nocardioidaceae bacterium]
MQASGWEAESRSTRVAAGLLIGLLAAFLVVVGMLTPWHPLPGADVDTAPIHHFFTQPQINRSQAFFDADRWPSWLGLLAGLIVAAVLAFSVIGHRAVSLVRLHIPLWWLQVITLVTAVSVIETAATAPFGLWSAQLGRDYGLSTQSLGGWAVDRMKALLLGVAVASMLLLALIGLARRFTRAWFVPAAVGAGVLVVVFSFSYPIVVEPLFSRFAPLPPGPLRTQLLQLAHRDGVNVSDVLVVDASRRTTALNAYVSGFGTTKRIVIYDTLLKSVPDKEINVIVAHELGHAKSGDVVIGTLEGALAASAGIVALFLLLRPRLLRKQVDAGSVGDPAIVPVVMGLAVLVSFAALPIQDTLSRHVEARADAHCLQLTHDPSDFISLQQRLAVTNLDHLQPNGFLSFWFNNHPPTLDRIGMALAWERLHGPGVTPSSDWIHSGSGAADGG